MFKRMKLGTKIYCGFAVIVMFLGITSAVSWTRLDAIGKGIEVIVADRFPKTVSANQIINGINLAARCMRNIILTENKADMDKEAARIAEVEKSVTEQLDKLQKTIASERGKALLQDIFAAREAYARPKDEMLKFAFDGNKMEATDILFKKIRSAQGTYFGAVNELIDYQTELVDKAGATAQDLEKSALALIMVLGIAALVISAVGAFIIVRSITRPINRVVEGLKAGAEQVASAAGQVSSSSQSLAEGASEQASSIEETSSSLEEMSSMTRQNADNASQADNLMKEASRVVTRANASMNGLIGSMDEISKASQETSKIIKTIDEIAFQTNLLALNAAVEAARAGEAGAGFAVVADEVRNLAMRAAEAAKNTASLIEGTVKKVKEGSELVADTNQAFIEVADSTTKVGGIVAEIAAASGEQSQGIGQINTAVNEMDKITQQNAAVAEESASASEEMTAQAEQMKVFVDELVAMVDGARLGNGRHRERAAAKIKRPAAHIVHRAAALSTPAKARGKNLAVRTGGEVRPDQLIPLDDDEGEFQDF